MALPLLLLTALSLSYIVTRWAPRYPEGQKDLGAWAMQGKLQMPETVREGLANMPAAFVELFTGGNTGKMVVKV